MNQKEARVVDKGQKIECNSKCDVWLGHWSLGPFHCDEAYGFPTKRREHAANGGSSIATGPTRLQNLKQTTTARQNLLAGLLGWGAARRRRGSTSKSTQG